jgi:hypothetical protein
MGDTLLVVERKQKKILFYEKKDMKNHFRDNVIEKFDNCMIK